MTDLVVITHVSELGALPRAGPGKRTTLATSDAAVGLRLRAQGADFIDLWQFLGHATLATNRRQASELAAAWLRLVPDAGLASWVLRLSAADLLYPFEILLNSETAGRGLLDIVLPTSIVAFEQPRVGVLRTGPAPVTPASHALFDAVLQFEAGHRGISFTARPAHDIGRHPRTGPGRQAALRPSFPTADEVDVLLLENGFAGPEVGDVEQQLRGDGVKTLRIPELSHPAFLGVIDRQPLPAAVSAELHLLETTMVGPQVADQLGHPAIFDNPHLRFQFDRIWQEVNRSIRLALLMRQLVQAVRPKVVVLGHDAFTREQSLVKASQSAGVPVATFLHSGLGHGVGYDGICGPSDRILTWNWVDNRELVRRHVPLEQLTIVGHSGGTRTLPGLVPRTLGGRHRRRPTSAGRRRVVLLTAAVHSGLAAPVADPPEHQRTWLGLLDLFERHPEWECVVKSHPSYDHFDLLDEVAALAPGRITSGGNLTLDDALRGADVALGVNYATTALLTAMAAGVPVLLLDTAILPEDVFQPSLDDTQLLRARSIDELEDALTDLFADEGQRAAHQASGLRLAAELLAPEAAATAAQAIKDLGVSTGGDPMPLVPERPAWVAAFAERITSAAGPSTPTPPAAGPDGHEFGALCAIAHGRFPGWRGAVQLLRTVVPHRRSALAVLSTRTDMRLVWWMVRALKATKRISRR